MEENQDLIEGRNSVIELLKSGKDINKLYIQKGERHGSITEIIKLAKQNKVIIQEVDKFKLDKMSETHNHQGVLAIVPPYEYCDVDDILEEAKNRGEDPFILILDGIEDPHNLGSIIRTAECSRSSWNNNTKKKISFSKQYCKQNFSRFGSIYENSKSKQFK